MVVDDFDILGSSLRPLEADAPLVVDPDAPLAGTVALEPFKPVGRRYTKVSDLPGGIDETQLAQSNRLNVRRQPSAA
jgi:hypothetical protein